MKSNKKRPTYTKKQWALFITGLIALFVGMSIIGFYGVRKIYREIQKQKLLRDNPVVEITELIIKAPILEGTEQSVLSKAAGHSSTIYKEYFNSLKNAKSGRKVNLYDKNKKCYSYIVKEVKIVEPDETWILDDFGDDRITIVTCTDDGTQRLVVVAILSW